MLTDPLLWQGWSPPSLDATCQAVHTLGRHGHTSVWWPEEALIPWQEVTASSPDGRTHKFSNRLIQACKWELLGDLMTLVSAALAASASSKCNILNYGCANRVDHVAM